MAAAEKELYLKIGRPHNSCAACGADVAHAGKHPSVLRRGGGTIETEGELSLDPDAPRREDYCAECWQRLADDDFMGYWLARREPPKPRKIETKKERNAGLLAWFEHLQGLPSDEETSQSLFFLAHMLMKYGVFKWLRTDKDSEDNETIYFRQTGSEEEIPIRSLELSDDRSVEIKKDLDAFLLQFANAQSSSEESNEAPAVEE